MRNRKFVPSVLSLESRMVCDGGGAAATVFVPITPDPGDGTSPPVDATDIAILLSMNTADVDGSAPVNYPPVNLPLYGTPGNPANPGPD